MCRQETTHSLMHGPYNSSSAALPVTGGSPPRRRSVVLHARLPTHVRVQANVGTADELRSRDRSWRRVGVARRDSSSAPLPDVYRRQDCADRWQWRIDGARQTRDRESGCLRRLQRVSTGRGRPWCSSAGFSQQLLQPLTEKTLRS